MLHTLKDYLAVSPGTLVTELNDSGLLTELGVSAINVYAGQQGDLNVPYVHLMQEQSIAPGQTYMNGSYATPSSILVRCAIYGSSDSEATTNVTKLRLLTYKVLFAARFPAMQGLGAFRTFGKGVTGVNESITSWTVSMVGNPEANGPTKGPEGEEVWQGEASLRINALVMGSLGTSL